MNNIEPKDLLTPTAILVALSFAIFVSFLPKALDVLRERFKAVRTIDVPVCVRKSAKFKIEVLLDGLLLYTITFSSLLLSSYFVYLLRDIIRSYINENGWSPLSIANNLNWGIIGLGILLGLILATAVAMFLVGRTVSNSLPPIIKAYAEIVLGKRGEYGLTDILLRTARKYDDQGEYTQSVLFATSAIDYELRRRFAIDAPYSFSTLIQRLVNREVEKISAERISTMIMIRNRVVIETSEHELTKDDATQALSFMDDVLNVLNTRDLTLLYGPLKYR